MASTISFAGMSSGLDTDTIVEAMVSNYKLKVDNSAKKELLLEWKQDIYKDVSKKVYNFYTGIASKLRLESTFNKKLLTVSDTTAVKLDNTSTVPSGTHTLSGLKMATSAQLQTYKMSSALGSVSSTSTMEELGIEMEKSITISDGTGEDKKTTIISFVNEVPEETKRDKGTIYLISTDKISDLQSALREAMPRASVNFDDKAEAFFISSSTTGENQKIEISGSTNVLKGLGLVNSDLIDDGTSSITVEENGNSIIDNGNGQMTLTAQGSNGSYTYNGIKMVSSSNNVSINGLKFSIISNTDEQITLSSTTDVEGIASTIKSFVEEYNSLISDIGDLINADSAGSYEPLLDEEKEGMTDSQIEKWEKKIKDSLLRNDSTLKTLVSTMRSMLSGTLSTNSTYKSLSSIGVTTSSDWTSNGKLELDEDKLKEALTDNADEIIALFSANGRKENTNKNEVDTTKGLGDRIYDALGDSFKRIANVKSATSLFSDTLLTKQRATQAETTNKSEDRLEKMREIYLKKFTAMETALSKLNSQTDTLTSLLSS